MHYLIKTSFAVLLTAGGLMLLAGCGYGEKSPGYAGGRCGPCGVSCRCPALDRDSGKCACPAGTGEPETAAVGGKCDKSGACTACAKGAAGECRKQAKTTGRRGCAAGAGAVN